MTCEEVIKVGTVTSTLNIHIRYFSTCDKEGDKLHNKWNELNGKPAFCHLWFLITLRTFALYSRPAIEGKELSKTKAHATYLRSLYLL